MLLGRLVCPQSLRPALSPQVLYSISTATSSPAFRPLGLPSVLKYCTAFPQPLLVLLLCLLVGPQTLRPILSPQVLYCISPATSSPALMPLGLSSGPRPALSPQVLYCISPTTYSPALRPLGQSSVPSSYHLVLLSIPWYCRFSVPLFTALLHFP